MPIDVKAIIAEIDAVLAEANRAVEEARRRGERAFDYDYYAEGAALLLAAIERWAPMGSPYRALARSAAEKHANGYSSSLTHVLPAYLLALKADYIGGRLLGVTEAIHRDLLTDFLETAEHFLGEGWPDAAAVTAGVALEEHLRKLCDKTGGKVSATDGDGKFRKAQIIAQDLREEKILDLTDAKHVTAWLGLRNDGAHPPEGVTGKPGRTLDPARVRLMIDGVRDFLRRLPA